MSAAVTPTVAASKPSDVAAAWRVAFGCVLCWLIVAYYHLDHGNLAVWTVYMVMANHPFTIFQKGIERIAGRCIGVLGGVALVTWTYNQPILSLLCEFAFLLACFYPYFAGRLAYTWLNAGLYAAVMIEIGRVDVADAWPQGCSLMVAIVIGVVVSDLVAWLGGEEQELGIEFGKEPLFPIRWDWINRAAMLVVTALCTLFFNRWLELPPEQGIVSVMMLAVAPDMQALLHKGELRLEGALLATLWAVMMFVVVGLLPRMFLFAALLFLGMFLAAYLARVGGDNSYAGIQMGLVLAMLVVADPHDFGEISAAVLRIEGALGAICMSLIVGGLWPRFPVRK